MKTLTLTILAVLAAILCYSQPHHIAYRVDGAWQIDTARNKPRTDSTAYVLIPKADYDRIIGILNDAQKARVKFEKWEGNKHVLIEVKK